jgi:hypothetical protein
MSMMPSRLLTCLASPSFSLADLRSQTPMIIVGVILLAVGMGAVTLFFFRHKTRDLALIYFSIFSILYAVRLLLRTRVVRSLAGVSDSLVDHINLWITFTLLIPFLLFLRQVLGGCFRIPLCTQIILSCSRKETALCQSSRLRESTILRYF